MKSVIKAESPGEGEAAMAACASWCMLWGSKTYHRFCSRRQRLQRIPNTDLDSVQIFARCIQDTDEDQAN